MAFVDGIVYKRLAPGQTLTIFGGLFDHNCSVYFGSEKASVVDYDDDYIEVLVPITKGSYDVTLNDGANTLVVGNVDVVELVDTPKRWYPRDYTQDDFVDYVRSLLPSGKAFALWNGSNFRKLLNAIANAFWYTWTTIKLMVDSVDPTHTENFDYWEGELNLPITGIYPETFEGRRAEIYRAECMDGGCTTKFFAYILSLMGKSADVLEYTKNPEAFANVDFGDDDPRYYFMIRFHLKSEDFSTFHAGVSCAGEYLLDFTQYEEESVFNQIKPSHTKIVYAYDDGVRIGYIIGKNNERIVDGNGEPLTTTTYLW